MILGFYVWEWPNTPSLTRPNLKLGHYNTLYSLIFYEIFQKNGGQFLVPILQILIYKSNIFSDSEEDAKDKDYDYLLGMPMWSLTAERKEALLKQKEGKHDELRKLRKTTKEDMWLRDLDEFIEKLTEVETKEMEEDSAGVEDGKILKLQLVVPKKFEKGIT